MKLANTPIVGERRTVTTEELEKLLENYDVYLPMATVEESALGVFDSAEQQFLEVTPEENRIVAVESDGIEEVQCIMVDHPDHLYMTDDFIVTHNTSNIIFLKSTDDKMIDTLTKMSGVRHRTYRDSKTVTMDTKKMVKSTAVDGTVSYNMSTVEEPVISYNDLAFISERNSIVFRAGDSPVWNRNETILPMSWRMFGGSGENSIVHPGHEYSLQTIPTLSTAKDFDVRLNQPNFTDMVMHRVEQVALVKEAEEKYARGYDYTAFDIQALDPDIYAEDIMTLVNIELRNAAIARGEDPDEIDGAMEEVYDPEAMGFDIMDDYEEKERLERAAQEREIAGKPRYAGGQLSRLDLVDTHMAAQTDAHGEPVESEVPIAQHGLDETIINAYLSAIPDFRKDPMFITGSDNSLRLSKTGATLIWQADDESSKMAAMQAMEDGRPVYAENEKDIESVSSWQVTDEMYFYLTSLENWKDIAGGEFERRMTLLMRDGS